MFLHIGQHGYQESRVVKRLEKTIDLNFFKAYECGEWLEDQAGRQKIRMIWQGHFFQLSDFNFIKMLLFHTTFLQLVDRRDQQILHPIILANIALEIEIHSDKW